MQAKIYNQNGKETGTINLPEKVFGVPFNRDVVHEVTVAMRSNSRSAIAHTKGRSDVRGGGKKPWQQKGTGRARHGSRRSPLWRGGGVTFGPTKEKNYEKKINKKVKIKALFMLLSSKVHDGEVLFLDSLTVEGAKTKNAKKIIETMSSVGGFELLQTKKKNAALIYTAEKNSSVERGFNNFGNISIATIHSMNPLDVATYKYIIITEPDKSIRFLENKLKSKS